MKPKKIIYKVTCTLTNEVYIGATGRSVEERKKDHEQKAEKGLGSYFQEAIATYGPNAFKWEQIDTANTNDELAQKEANFVLEYKSYENGFNQDHGGGIQKSVHQYSLEREYLQSFESLEEAAGEVGGKRTSVSNACLDYNRTYRGFYWSYKKSDSYQGRYDGRKKKVIQYSLPGNAIAVFDSVASASLATGISKTCISRCCRGEREKSGGFRWQYQDVELTNLGHGEY